MRDHLRGRLAAAVLLAIVVTAPALAAGETTPEISFTTFTLDNGLTLVVHEDHKAPIVAVNVWYHVGSKNEPERRTGFAHLFEHLMFNGSENYDDDYFQAMSDIGATTLNGTTNQDRTNYFQDVPTSAVDVALWMESDRMGHLVGAITQDKLVEQIGVVQNEKRQGENEPYARSDDLITTRCYPTGHPYSHTVIGSMEDLSAATLEDVKHWFSTYYGPSNAVLVIAGDIDAETARTKVEHYFGDIPPGPPVSHPETWVAQRHGEIRETMLDRVPHSRVDLVWNVPEWGSLDHDRLELIARILAEGKTSRLYRRLVYDDQIARNVSAFVDSREIGSLFQIEATAQPGGDVEQVERAVREELQRLFADGPTAEEVERARTGFVADFVRGSEAIGGFGGKSDTLARCAVFRDDPACYATTLEHVRAAGTTELRDTARQWLSDGVYVLDVLPFGDLSAAETGADRSKLPEVGTPPQPRFVDVQRATLSNGLKLVLAERHAVPLVDFDLRVDAGYAADRGASPGTAQLTLNMLDEGAGKRDALQISEALSRLGAELSTGSNVDVSTVSLSALKSNLDPSLGLFADVILRPTFPEDQFRRLQKQQLTGIEAEKVQPIAMALRVFPGLLYGADHPYGAPLTGSGFSDTVSKLTREDLKRFHQAWFKPGNATLVVVGDTTMAEIRPKLEALFRDWKPGDVPDKTLTTVARKTEPSVYILDRPGSLQSVIMAAHVAPPRGSARDLAYEVMNTVLGGTFISRVNMNIREDKHWSYGAQTILFDARGQRPFLAFAPVQTDKTKESMVEVLRELRDIRGSRPVTAEELARVKRNLVLELPGSWETNGDIEGSLAEMVRFGLPDDYFNRYPGRVEELSLDDVNSAARDLIRPDALVWVVVGDREKIEPGIRELGLGEIHVLDVP